jgi:hypothetical protein
MTAAILLLAAALLLAGCGSASTGTPPTPPAELWPSGLYALDHPQHGTLYVAVDGLDVQIATWTTEATWTFAKGGHITGRARIPDQGWLTFGLYPGLRFSATYSPLTWSGTARLVVAHG